MWAGGIERWCRRAVDSTYPCRNYTTIYDRNSLARVKKDTSDVGYILLSMISYLRYCVCISNLIHVSRHNTHHSTIASVQKQDDARRKSQHTRCVNDRKIFIRCQAIIGIAIRRLEHQSKIDATAGTWTEGQWVPHQEVNHCAIGCSCREPLYLRLFVKSFAFRAAYGLLNYDSFNVILWRLLR